MPMGGRISRISENVAHLAPRVTSNGILRKVCTEQRGATIKESVLEENAYMPGTPKPGEAENLEIPEFASWQAQLDWMVCQVTTQLLPNSRQIALALPDMAARRLNERSWVRPDRMMAMNERIFGNTVARLTDAKTAEVLAAIRSFF